MRPTLSEMGCVSGKKVNFVIRTNKFLRSSPHMHRVIEPASELSSSEEECV